MITTAHIELIPQSQNINRSEAIRAEALLRAANPAVPWHAASADMHGDVASMMQVARQVRSVLRRGHVNTFSTLVKFDATARRVQALKKIS